jgi:hypothetical protein
MYGAVGEAIMRTMHCFSFILALGAFCGCAANNASTTEDADLIGGRQARANERPATMLVKGNCTVAKVGPRHILTAAHCVDGAAAYKFAPGATIEITNAKAFRTFADPNMPAESPWKTAVVERTEIHPAWREKCASGTIVCGSVHISGRNQMPDLAVIITKDPIADVPTVAVDLSPVVPGDRVAVTGYGCEEAVGGNWDYANSRLRVAETAAEAFDRTIHEGSFIYRDDRDNGVASMMDGIYVITPGPKDAPSGEPAGESSEPANGAAGKRGARGGLCPGDSGGPLYRIGLTTSVVVGVNANYTFSGGQSYPLGDGTDRSFSYGGSPVSNWHTRVDSATGLKTGTWLRDLGVRTTCSRGACE